MNGFKWKDGILFNCILLGTFIRELKPPLFSISIKNT